MKTAICLLLILGLAGCDVQYRRDPVPVIQKVPSIEVPIRPVLEKMTPDELVEYEKIPATIRAKIEGNSVKMMIYSDQAIASIREYNIFAKFNNQRSADWVKGGLKDEPVPAEKPK